MAQIIPFNKKEKVENLNNFIAQAKTSAEIEDYRQAIKRLTDRGKLTGADAKQLNKTLKIRQATLRR